MRVPASGLPAPLLLIIPGSGPTDRDGNSPPHLRAATYRLLAKNLADQGVATVRIDKRGMFTSAAAAVDANKVTIADYAADVRAWTAMLHRRTHGNCIWLGGHSEGTLVALVAAPSDPHVCGLVLMAAPGRRFSDVLRDQLRAGGLDALDLVDAMEVIAELEAGRTADVSHLDPRLLPLFYPGVQRFLISQFSYEPAALLKNYGGPVLVLHAAEDLQVSLRDATALKTARAGVAYVELPGVNHFLKVVPANDRQANLAAYADPGLPLAPGIAEAIAAFVRGHSPN